MEQIHDFLFANVGKKIKILAKISFWILSIGLIIFGIVLRCEEVTIGLLPLFLGPVVAWILSLLAYGFGEIVENTSILAGKETKKEENNLPEF